MSAIDPTDAANENAAATRIFLRPIATPFPLGFFALATASLLTAGAELSWFSSSGQTLVALGLVGFAFPLQMLASVFGFLGRDTVAATGFGVQGVTWGVVGAAMLMSGPGHTSGVIGVLLFASSAWVGLCALGASLGKLGPALVLALTSARFLVTGLYEVTANAGVEHAAAIVGLVLVAAVGYVSFALEVENLQRRTILPLLRRGRGREALHGDLAVQTRTVHREAGVREQL